MIEGVCFIQIQAGFIQAVYIEVCFLSHAGWGGKGYSFLIYRAYTQGYNTQHTVTAV